MKRRHVFFAEAARRDLIELGDWIAEHAGADIALGYIARIEAYCASLALAGERGQRRDDIRPGVRIVGLERRIAIAFIVTDLEVTILRLHYGGRNWSS